MKLLEGKISMVTGGGSGIGRQIALKYAIEGSKVILADLDEKGGQETISMIERAGGMARFVKADSSIPTDSERVVGEAMNNYGALHIAVNNAGIGGPSAPTGEYPIDGWDKVISVNLSGVFYGMRYQIPSILKSGGGSIINIASILGQVGFPGSVAYVAAKHGVVGLSQNAALEYSAKKIRINVVGPGFINTPLIEKNMTKEAREALVALHPIGRLGEASEVAELVLWLGSDKASFVTGAYYAIDGGYLAQ
jgi:NAD(P)-dependent dehydrogenase (short-subunit alcohol dehydrogenase family)